MKRIISITSLIIIFASSLLVDAGTKPKDVYGWDNVKWGMTAEEVETVLGKKVKRRNAKHDERDKMYSGLQLKGIKMGRSEVRASFWMDEESKKLKRIVFVPEGQLAQYELAETFINLENYLVGKYGDPDVEKTSNDPGTSADRKWEFPSTEIELSYLRIEDSELLLLVFSQRDGLVK